MPLYKYHAIVHQRHLGVAEQKGGTSDKNKSWPFGHLFIYWKYLQILNLTSGLDHSYLITRMTTIVHIRIWHQQYYCSSYLR